MNQKEEPLSISKHSELIQKKFSQIIQRKTSNITDQQPQKRQQFKPDQLEKIKRDFETICPSQKLQFEDFRASLGLFGSEDFFIRRLFDLLDEDGDGKVTVNDYNRYLDVIFNGSQLERANFGWKLITGSRSYIQLKDFHQLFYQIALMWNAITGEVVTPKRQYIQQIFSLFDLDHDETITLQDYKIFFSEQSIIFGWFQFLNNFPLEEQLIKMGFKYNRDKLQLKRRQTIDKYRNSTKQQQKIMKVHKQDLFKKKFKDLCHQLRSLSNFAKQSQKQKSIQKLSQVSPFLDLSSKVDHSFLSRSNEPVVLLRAQTKQDRQDTSEYIDLLPHSKKYLMKGKVDLPERDTSGKVMTQLKLCLDKVNILQEVCRQLVNKNQQQRSVLKKKKQLQVKLEVVNKKNQKQQRNQQQLSELQHKNLAVYFGHMNWNLVLNLMVGMRQSIKSLHDLGFDMQLKNSHFKQKQSFVLSSKVQQFRSGQSYYKFQDYAPSVFQKLRQSVGISNRSYQLSVGPEILIGKLAMGNLTAISEKFSTGKSGSFFYQTHDGKYLLKTIKKNQYQHYTKILKDYYEHLMNNPHTLIVKMFGLYKLKQFKNKKKIETIRFISMQNVFYGGLKKIAVYDLKGSSYDRRGNQHQYKDNDWEQHNQKIELPKIERQTFKQQIKKDSQFLKSNNINDYSILIGMCQIPKNKLQGNAFPNNKSMFRRIAGGCENLKGDQIYIMSIIDCLTQFEFKKHLQWMTKRTFLGQGVSCVPPTEYSERFISFLTKSVSNKQ